MTEFMNLTFAVIFDIKFTTLFCTCRRWHSHKSELCFFPITNYSTLCLKQRPTLDLLQFWHTRFDYDSF